MINILNKNFFKSEIGRRMANKYLGYCFEEKADQRTIKQEGQTAIKEDVENPEPIALRNLSNTVEKIASGKATEQTLGLHDIVRYFSQQGVIGEENLVVAATLTAVNKTSFGVEGYSGSGKTFIADKLVYGLLPDVYVIQQSSDLALFNDAERVNLSKYIYIPELQKALKKSSAIVEAIKDITEGKDANRIATKGNQVSTYSIKKGKCIIYTLAIENSYKKDAEASRRFVRLQTNYSKEHADKIHNEKATQRFSFEDSTHPGLEARLKNHISEVSSLELGIIDPFADYVSKIIPRTQKSVAYVDHYYSLLDGCGKFHANQRVRFRSGEKDILILNLEDHFQVHQAYYDEFVNTLKRSDDSVHRKTIDWSTCFNEACSKMKEKLPEYFDKWYESQVTDGRLTVQDYKTGDMQEVL